MNDENNLSDAFGLNETGITKLQRRATSDPEVDRGVDDEREESIKESFDDEETFEDEDLPSGPDSDDVDAFPVGVYLLPDTIRKIAQVRRRTGKQNAEIAMDAIDIAYRRGRLAKLIEKRSTVVKRPKGSLFPSRRGQGRRSGGGGRRKLWSFQSTAKEQEILEDLEGRFGAASMSELVAVSLEAQHAPMPNRAPSASDS